MFSLCTLAQLRTITSPPKRLRSLENTTFSPLFTTSSKWLRKTFVKQEHGASSFYYYYFILHDVVFVFTSCRRVSRPEPGKPACGTCSCPQPVASASWTTPSSQRRLDAWLSPRKSLTARLLVKHLTAAADTLHFQPCVSGRAKKTNKKMQQLESWNALWNF